MKTTPLHEALDLALAQYLLAHPGSLPSETTVLDLIKWHATRLDTGELDAAPATPLPRFDEALDALSNDLLIAMGALAMGNPVVQRSAQALFAARPLIRAVLEVARRHPAGLAAALAKETPARLDIDLIARPRGAGPQGHDAVPHDARGAVPRGDDAAPHEQQSKASTPHDD